MKVVFVVDSIKDLNKKINMMQSHFGNDIIFVVKANLAKLFGTYGHFASAIYNNNLAKVVHFTLARLEISSVVMYYSSCEINNPLLDAFSAKIADGSKVVNVVPTYNAFEQFCNSIYNIYVKTIFKNNDSLASPKLQFLPQKFVEELLSTHFGNKLFETPVELTQNLETNNKQINASLKIKPTFNKYAIIPLIIALATTACLIMALAFWGGKYLVVFVFVLLYVLNIFLTIVLQCKNFFDSRFLK